MKGDNSKDNVLNKLYIDPEEQEALEIDKNSKKNTLIKVKEDKNNLLKITNRQIKYFQNILVRYTECQQDYFYTIDKYQKNRKSFDHDFEEVLVKNPIYYINDILYCSFNLLLKQLFYLEIITQLEQKKEKLNKAEKQYDLTKIVNKFNDFQERIEKNYRAQMQELFSLAEKNEKLKNNFTIETNCCNYYANYQDLDIDPCCVDDVVLIFNMQIKTTLSLNDKNEKINKIFEDEKKANRKAIEHLNNLRNKIIKEIEDEIKFEQLKITTCFLFSFFILVGLLFYFFKKNKKE